MPKRLNDLKRFRHDEAAKQIADLFEAAKAAATEPDIARRLSAQNVFAMLPKGNTNLTNAIAAVEEKVLTFDPDPGIREQARKIAWQCFEQSFAVDSIKKPQSEPCLDRLTQSLKTLPKFEP